MSTLLKLARRVVASILGRRGRRGPDPDGGAGVLVPAGPRPRTGGAQAAPPAAKDH